MLYYLFEYLEQQYQFPGASLFQFLTFRAAMAVLQSLILATVFGKSCSSRAERDCMMLIG